MSKRETQRQRAERWAKCNVWVDEDGALTIRHGGGHKLCVYGGRPVCVFRGGDEAPIRALLVETWMRARRARK